MDVILFAAQKVFKNMVKNMANIENVFLAGKAWQSSDGFCIDRLKD